MNRMLTFAMLLLAASSIGYAQTVPWADVTHYGARAGQPAGEVTTATTQAGSDRVTLGSARGFEVGDGIVISNAGAAASAPTPAGPAVSVIGPVGHSTVSYECVAADYYEGLSAASAAGRATDAPQVEGVKPARISSYSISNGTATIDFAEAVTAREGEHIILSGPTMQSAGIAGIFLVKSAPSGSSITVDAKARNSNGRGTSRDTGRLVNGFIIRSITRSTSGTITVTTDDRQNFTVGTVVQIYGVAPMDFDGWYAIASAGTDTFTINTAFLPSSTETGSVLRGLGENWSWNTMGVVAWEWNMVRCPRGAGANASRIHRFYVYANYGSGYSLIGSTLPATGSMNDDVSNQFRDWGPMAEAGYAPPPAANVPAAPPTSSRNDEYVGRIAAIDGNVVRVRPAPAASVSGAKVFHDNSLAIQAADNAACKNHGGAVYFPPGVGSFVWNAPFDTATANYCYWTKWILAAPVVANDTADAIQSLIVDNGEPFGWSAAPQFATKPYTSVSGVGDPQIEESNAGGLAPLIVRGLAFSAQSNGQTNLYDADAYGDIGDSSFWANSHDAATPLVLGGAGFSMHVHDLNVQGAPSISYGGATEPGQPKSMIPLGAIDIVDGFSGMQSVTLDGQNTFIGRGIELDSSYGQSDMTIPIESFSNVQTYQAPWQPFVFGYSTGARGPAVSYGAISNLTCDSNLVPAFANLVYTGGSYHNFSITKARYCAPLVTGSYMPGLVEDNPGAGQNVDVASSPGAECSPGQGICVPHLYGTNYMGRNLAMGGSIFFPQSVMGVSATAQGRGTWAAGRHEVDVAGAGWDGGYGPFSRAIVQTNGSEAIQVRCTIPSGYAGVWIAVDSRGQGLAGTPFRSCPVTLTGDHFTNFFQYTQSDGTPAISPRDIKTPLIRVVSGVHKVDVKAAALDGDYVQNLPAASGTLGLMIAASFTTTSASSDAVTVPGMTPSGHCYLTATNSAAARLTGVYVSAKSKNQIRVAHSPAAGAKFDVVCSPN